MMDWIGSGAATAAAFRRLSLFQRFFIGTAAAAAARVVPRRFADAVLIGPQFR